MLADLVPCEAPPGSQTAVCSLCPGRRQTRELWGLLLIRALIPFWKALPSGPSHLPKAPPADATTRGLGLNTCIPGGYKHSAYSTFPIREDWVRRKQTSETTIESRRIFFFIENRSHSSTGSAQDAPNSTHHRKAYTRACGCLSSGVRNPSPVWPRLSMLCSTPSQEGPGPEELLERLGWSDDRITKRSFSLSVLSARKETPREQREHAAGAGPG